MAFFGVFWGHKQSSGDKVWGLFQRAELGLRVLSLCFRVQGLGFGD